MEENLDNPQRLWGHIVENQLDQTSVQLLIVLFSFGQQVPIQELEEALQSYQELWGDTSSHREFLRALKILERTMIRISPHATGSPVEYHNQSITDYMREYISSAEDIVQPLLRAVISFEQLENLWVQASQDGRLYGQLRHSVNDLRDAILRTYEDDGVGYEEIFGRSVTALDIAEELGLTDVTRLVIEWLSPDWFSIHSVNLHDIAPVIDRLNLTSFPEAVSVREGIIHKAVEPFIEDLSTWGDARTAESFLEDLGGNAPSSARDKVENALMDMAQDAITYIVERREGSTYTEPELRDILEWADSWSGSDELFEGLSEAKVIAAALLTPKESPSVTDVEIDDDAHGISDNPIERILSSLKDLPE
jgi:hypothetical protein